MFQVEGRQAIFKQRFHNQVVYIIVPLSLHWHDSLTGFTVLRGIKYEREFPVCWSYGSCLTSPSVVLGFFISERKEIQKCSALFKKRERDLLVVMYINIGLISTQLLCGLLQESVGGIDRLVMLLAHRGSCYKQEYFLPILKNLTWSQSRWVKIHTVCKPYFLFHLVTKKTLIIPENHREHEGAIELHISFFPLPPEN